MQRTLGHDRRAKADYPIEIVDRHLNKILDPTQIYSGMYANVCVNMYPYLYNGKKGIGCGLGPVQKTADGEAFGGGAPTAASVFTSMAANTQRINPADRQTDVRLIAGLNWPRSFYLKKGGGTCGISA